MVRGLVFLIHLLIPKVRRLYVDLFYRGLEDGLVEVLRTEEARSITARRLLQKLLRLLLKLSITLRAHLKGVYLFLIGNLFRVLIGRLLCGE